MGLVEECSQTTDKSLARTLISTLTTMTFDSSLIILKHVIKMKKIATRLKSLGMIMNENFLIQLILNSLPIKYGPFQMRYNTMRKWNVHELHNIRGNKA
uniref:Retrovirus-related Pol polyprotein from transposon TNT 1-94 n=1 Tax=Cajanus cajan TaxID=3821 RepID=A0A151SDJ7_CAJCA|nr:hypothetical protein KK1_025102 [Cajanus cajan]